ncbi:MAG: hypothetical protein JWN76_872 [Chitinophagaceae bacterium]|nr:hypothetical protein [Chitinophagaceae bacterium]
MLSDKTMVRVLLKGETLLFRLTQTFNLFMKTVSFQFEPADEQQSIRQRLILIYDATEQIFRPGDEILKNNRALRHSLETYVKTLEF